MNRVPVGASIAHAYEFLLGRFFQIIGTAWLPAAIFGTSYYYVLETVLPMLSAHPGDAVAMAGVLCLVTASVAAFLLIHTVIAVSLTQEALGVRKDMTLAHFVIGPRELRLFFAYLRYYLVFIVTYVVVLAVSAGSVFAARKYGMGLAPNLAPAGMPVAVFAALALTAILAIGFVLSMFRLYFLLAPVAAVEHRTRLSRAWSLTHRSTLRIFVVLLFACVPVIGGAVAALYYLIGPAELSALSKTLHDSKAGDHSALFAFLSAHALVLSLIAAALAVINGAMLAGASAHAYRATSGHEDSELEDDAALVAPLLTPVEPAHGHGEPAHEDHAGHDHGHEHHGHDEHGDHGDHGHDEVVPHDHEHGHGGHEDHAAGDHGHGEHEHGHEAHGHDDHGHEAHGHDDHGHGGHDDHDAHGHGGHDDHGHGDHGHNHHAHAGEDHRHAA